MKRCKSCRQMLDDSEFDESYRTNDGLMVRCHKCNEAHRESERTRYSTDSNYRVAKAAYYKQRADVSDFLINRAEHERKRYAQDIKYKEAKARYHKLRSGSLHYLAQRAEHERNRYSEDNAYKRLKSKYRMQRYRNYPRLRVDNNISSQIRQSLNQGKSGQSWEKLVGYTLNELVDHIESLFVDGMTWDNYGAWHIDHRIPRTWFNYESADDPAFRECWTLSNLQPKWGRENIKKGNRFVG